MSAPTWKDVKIGRGVLRDGYHVELEGDDLIVQAREIIAINGIEVEQ